MERQPRFRVGDIVVHAACNRNNGFRMIVMSAGHLENESGKTFIYQVSMERWYTGNHLEDGAPVTRVILEENELALAPIQTK